MKAIERFIKDESGLETVEYALIAALITLAVIATIKLVAIAVNNKYAQLENNLK